MGPCWSLGWLESSSAATWAASLRMRVPSDADELADDELRATREGCRGWLRGAVGGEAGTRLLLDTRAADVGGFAARLAVMVVRVGGARVAGEVGVDVGRSDDGCCRVAMLPLAFFDALTASE